MVISQNVAGAELASFAGAQGPMIGISTACTASSHALGEAYRRIQDGEAKMMLAGGYDALTSWVDVLGFSLLGLSPRTTTTIPSTRRGRSIATAPASCSVRARS